jgi:hypothetical protein
MLWSAEAEVLDTGPVKLAAEVELVDGMGDMMISPLTVQRGLRAGYFIGDLLVDQSLVPAVCIEIGD